MGQRYVPALHDPDYQEAQQTSKALSDKEADLLFEAIIAEMDARERLAEKSD